MKFLSLLTVIRYFLLIMLVSVSCSYASEKHDEHEETGHEEHEEEGKIVLNADQLKSAGILLAKAEPANIKQTIPLYGMIAFNHEGLQEISARFPGVIRTLPRKVGDKVGAGDTLATIESNDSLKTYALTAASSGVVIERHAAVGQQTGDATLFVLADMSSVWVEVSVFPRDMASVHSGQSVRVHHPQTGASGVGTISYIAPALDSANQSFTARVVLDNRQGQWPIGLFVTVEVELAQTSVPVAIKNSALQTLENQTVVFVQEKDGFEARPVRIGKADSDFSEVLAGLKTGETYVATNSFILKSDLGKEGAEHEH